MPWVEIGGDPQNMPQNPAAKKWSESISASGGGW
jgi:hypothetical protein